MNQSIITPRQFREAIEESKQYALKLYNEIRTETSTATAAVMALTAVLRTIARDQGIPTEVLERLMREGVMAMIAGVLPANGGEAPKA